MNIALLILFCGCALIGGAYLLYRRMPFHILYKSKQDLQNIFDSVNDPMVVIKDDYTILRANKAYAAFVGSSFKTILKGRCYSILRGLDVPCPDCRMKDAFSASHRCSIERSENPKTPGHVITISFFPYVSKAGSQPYIIEQIRDISALERLKLTLENQNAILLKISDTLSQEQNKTHEELELARQIQLGIMPTVLPVFEGITLAAQYHPIEAVGGDIYDFISFADGSVGVFIGDVSGHGLASAFVGTIAKISLYNFAHATNEPSQLLSVMNEEFLRSIHSGHYLTCFWGIINAERNLITFARAGHPKPIKISRTNEVTILNSTGTFVGILNAAHFEQNEMSLDSGDRLYFFTDGIYEIMSERRDGSQGMLGYEHFKSILLECNKNPFDKILEVLEKQLEEYIYEDDYTIVLLEVT